MAVIKGTRKILKSDIPDAPGWFDPIISTLNSFFDTVIGALRGRLTFRDNFYCQVKEFTFTHGVELEVLYDGIEDYKGILIVKSPEEESSDYAIANWKARRVKPNTLGVTIEFKGAGTTEGKVKFIILG